MAERKEEKCSIRCASVFHASSKRPCAWPDEYRLVAIVPTQGDVVEVLEALEDTESWSSRPDVVISTLPEKLRPTRFGDVVLFDGESYLWTPEGLVRSCFANGDLVDWKKEFDWSVSV